MWHTSEHTASIEPPWTPPRVFGVRMISSMSLPAIAGLSNVNFLPRPAALPPVTSSSPPLSPSPPSWLSVTSMPFRMRSRPLQHDVVD